MKSKTKSKDDKITVLIDGAEQTVPPISDEIRCPDHPDGKIEIGFGLAGGGYGTYTYCDVCGRILSKEQEE